MKKGLNLCWWIIVFVSQAAIAPAQDTNNQSTGVLIRRLQEEYSKGRVWEIAQALAKTGDPHTIPAMIGVIDADNSYDTIYGVGYFGLGFDKMRDITKVKYSPYHDGAWWRRWWVANKSRFPQDVQAIPIPDLPKTKNGIKHVPFPAELDTVDGKMKFMREQFEKNNLRAVGDVAQELGEANDPRSIPLMIGIIDADNSYDTVYGVGYFGLGKITGVKYSEFHDGAWWRRWWAANKSKYQKSVQDESIPDLHKTANGRKHTPYPENIETFEGRTAYLHQMIRSGKLNEALGLSGIARAYAEAGDPRAIPVLIGVIDADNKYATVYGVGYFGLRELTGVQYDERHDGAWWKQWWADNKTKYPEAAQRQEIPDFRGDAAAGKGKQSAASSEKPASDVADVPSKEVKIGNDPHKKYFLIGPVENAPAPKTGYKLAIVMPGGDGGADFNPFVRRIYKHALDSSWIVAEPVAFKWTSQQQIVWPTKTHAAAGQQFSTEDFVETVVADVRAHYSIDPRTIVTLSWSSSGPAAYAISLQEKKSVTGSYIAMSVFRPQWLPPIANAKGHKYVIDHSPDDRLCPYAQVQSAREQLDKNGAIVKASDYKGGHGWRGDVYGRIKQGMDWLSRD